MNRAKRFRHRIAQWLAPDLCGASRSISQIPRSVGGQPAGLQADARSAKQDTLASVTVRVDDSAGWEALTPGPSDRPWAERAEDLDDAFEAWLKNFLVRRVVTLARSYVIGNGITVTSKDPQVAAFIHSFWNHRQNHLDTRLASLVNELVRAGEVFPTLHTNRTDGMSYVRFIPATQIREIRTADNDYELELEYGEMQAHTTELKWWPGLGHRHAWHKARGAPGGHYKPLMLHYAINREIGCTRGEGDITPLLPWAKRYTAWLQDRVRLNRVRTRQAVLEIEIADDAKVEQKQHQLRTSNPLEAGTYVHGPGETLRLHGLNIGADDAQADGLALRLACGAAANVGLHYLGEGEAVNYATAQEMGEPTARYYVERQKNVIHILQDLVAVAYRRYCLVRQVPFPEDIDTLQLVATATEVARADNESQARSAHLIVQALIDMAAQGWVDDQTAAQMAFKFAGEAMGVDQIAEILVRASMTRSSTA